jgi:antitoxin component of MazEF toxin-antitoxin module
MAKKNRSVKVYGQSGSNYKTVPTIVLKGMWLEELGFEIGDFISVKCEDGKLVITPDAERMDMDKIEAAFMEKEMKAARKRFQEEKEEICAQYVAERKVGYGA